MVFENVFANTLVFTDAIYFVFECYTYVFKTEDIFLLPVFRECQPLPQSTWYPMPAFMFESFKQMALSQRLRNLTAGRLKHKTPYC